MNNTKLIEIDKSIVELQEELQKLNKLNESLKANSESAKTAIESAEKVSSSLSEVIKDTNELIQQGKQVLTEIQAVDFPKRLDKLDTTVSAVNQGIQNFQGRIDILERNLKDDLSLTRKTFSQSIDTKIEEFSSLILLEGNSRKRFLITIIVIQIITACLILLVLSTN